MRLPGNRDTLLTMDDTALSALCRITFSKGSGPGGQKRNKTSSAVTVTLPDTDYCAADCTERSQFRNRANALKKLRMQIALNLRQLPAEVPENINCSLSSPAYPLFAAQLLDLFADSQLDHKTAAEKCGLSSTAILKKFYRDPQLWQCVQQMRRDAGLPPFAAPK